MYKPTPRVHDHADAQQVLQASANQHPRAGLTAQGTSAPLQEKGGHECFIVARMRARLSFATSQYYWLFRNIGNGERLGIPEHAGVGISRDKVDCIKLPQIVSDQTQSSRAAIISTHVDVLWSRTTRKRNLQKASVNCKAGTVLMQGQRHAH